MSRQPKKNSGAFTKVLNQLMSEKKVSVRGAAELAGVSPSTVNSWRSGSTPSDFKAVKKLAKGLGVSFEFLLTGHTETTEERPVSIAETFEEGEYLYNGYARILIQKLTPRIKGD